MKKIIALFALIGLSFSVAACDYLKENGKRIAPINTDHDSGDK